MLLAMKGQQELVNPKGFFWFRENCRVSSLDKRLYRSKHKGAIVCREPFRGNPQKKNGKGETISGELHFFCGGMVGPHHWFTHVVFFVGEGKLQW